MPFAEAKKPNSFAAELEKEQVTPLADAGLIRAKDSKEPSKLQEIITQDKPLYLNPSEKELRKPDIEKGIKAFKEKELDNLPKDKVKAEKLLKLEALVYAMRDEGGLGINYVRYDKPTKPKTAEEVYKTKEGDCDDLSRLYVVLAKEQLGITGLSQFYVVFKNEKTKEEEGHAALFYVDGAVLYIDPGFEKAHVIPTKENSLEEAINNPEFRKELEDYQAEARGGNWKIFDIHSVPGQNSIEAVYCYEMGNYFSERGDFKKAGKYLQAAVDGGVKTFDTYLRLGEVYYESKEYGLAIKFLEAAKRHDENDLECLSYLAQAYFKHERYEEAANLFRKQIKSGIEDYETKFNLAVSCTFAADRLLKVEDYKKAHDLYCESENIFKSIIGIDRKDEQSIKDMLVYINERKSQAKKKMQQ